MAKFKKFGLAPVMLLLLLVAVGGTVALLTDASNEVENTFTPHEIDCLVVEKFDGTKKTNVAVQNTGTDDAYIRVKLVDYWVNAQGQVTAKSGWLTNEPTPANAEWVLGADGYYYYTLPVAKGGETKELIDTIELAEGQVLEIIASAIQANGGKADGGEAVVDAWDNELIDISVGEGGVLSVTEQA